MNHPASSLRVVIVRDRKSAGGGIHSYYEAIGRHLHVRHSCVDVGRAHEYYAAGNPRPRRHVPTPVRLLGDWLRLVFQLCRLPDLVVLNPSMDPVEWRSLPRDAVNVVLAKLFQRKVLVFWRGWENAVCGTAEFPRGNGGWTSRCYRLADAHAVLADDFRQDLRRWGFQTRIYLETTVVADALLDVAEASDHQIDPAIFRILYLSRIEEAKGVFELLDAFAVLAKKNPGKFSLTVAGDGPDLEELKSSASRLGLADVDFPGYVEGTEKVRHFTAASAFCFMSYTEGMPNAVLEAMAMGLPLVSSHAGGLKDFLVDGANGYILPQDLSQPRRRRFDPLEIAICLERLAFAPAEARRMGERNRHYARQRFGATQVAERMDAIYRKVAKQPLACC